MNFGPVAKTGKHRILTPDTRGFDSLRARQGGASVLMWTGEEWQV